MLCKAFENYDRMTHILKKAINTNTSGTIAHFCRFCSFPLKAYNYFVISLRMTFLWYADNTAVREGIIQQQKQCNSFHLCAMRILFTCTSNFSKSWFSFVETSTTFVTTFGERVVSFFIN